MKSLWKEFIKYAIPSVIGLMVSALYVVVDGIFVGRGIGPNALAAVNVAVPFTTLIIAISMMITMGGASIMSIRFGQNKEKEGNNIFLQSIFLVISITLIVSIISVIFPHIIAKLLGARDSLVDSTATYIKYYMLFGIGFSGSLALSTFIRNDGNPNLAMIALIVGAITNIVLDYAFIFIYDMGIAGAAIASGLGQISSLLLLSIHFIFKKGRLRVYMPKLNYDDLQRIMKVGMPEFINQLAPAITIYAFNIIILNRLGNIGVASFSIISYISIILVALFAGISQGIQPLISYNYGKKNFSKVKQIFKLGKVSNFVASILIYLALVLWGKDIVSIFVDDPALIHMTYNSMIIYMFSFIIASINIVNVTYYQATENSYIANIISISRGMVFTILALMILPLFIGNLGIWISIIIGEICTFLLVLYLKSKHSIIKVKSMDICA